jgi:nucleoside-triphosphatase THEP1
MAGETPSLKIRIITAPVNGGKSTRLRALVHQALSGGSSVGGFMTLPLWESPGKRKSGFVLELLPSGETMMAAGLEPLSGALPVGRFFLYPPAIAGGLKAVKDSLSMDITVLDEVGPAELSGDGHIKALEAALGRKDGEIWLCVRESLLYACLELIDQVRKKRPFRLFIEQPLRKPS